MPLHIHSPRRIPFRRHTCIRHIKQCRCECMWTRHVVCICIGHGDVLQPKPSGNGLILVYTGRGTRSFSVGSRPVIQRSSVRRVSC